MMGNSTRSRSTRSPKEKRVGPSGTGYEFPRLHSLPVPCFGTESGPSGTEWDRVDTFPPFGNPPAGPSRRRCCLPYQTEPRPMNTTHQHPAVAALVAEVEALAMRLPRAGIAPTAPTAPTTEVGAIERSAPTAPTSR